MLQITRSALEAVACHAEEAFPEECCGCLSTRQAGGMVTAAHRITNIQNKLHEQNPLEHTRTARDAYHLDEMELFEVQKSVDEKGEFLCGFYHSHPDEESYFSGEDKRRAMWEDQPMWPDAHYIIASVKRGKVAYAKSFAWSQEKKEFVEEPVVVVAEQVTT